MGNYSWLRAERTHKIANVVDSKKIKMLIPKQFGGGALIGVYDGYGNLIVKSKEYSIEELVYTWNKDFLENQLFKKNFQEIFTFYSFKRELDYLMRESTGNYLIDYRKQRVKEIEKIYDNLYKEYKTNVKKYFQQSFDIEIPTVTKQTEDRVNLISRYLSDSYLLPFPLKLVSVYYKGNYENCDGCSMEDPYQGLTGTTWEYIDEFYPERGEFTK